MWAEHRDWVSAKFEPRLAFLQIGAHDPEAVRNSLEEHYRRGLATVVFTMYSKTNTQTFDAQDVIVAYTTSFLNMLKVCEKLDIAPRRTLRLARRAYSLNGRRLIRGIREYEGRFSKAGLIEEAAGYPSTFEDHLAELSEKVLTLAVQPNYHQIPLHVIRTAVIKYPTSITGYLDSYIKDTSSKEISEEAETHVIFEVDKQQRQRTFVPCEIRKAGEALKEARRENFDVAASEIADTLGVAEADIIAFENGEVTDLNPAAIYQAAAEFMDTENEQMKEMHNQIEVLNWLRTFSHTKRKLKTSMLGKCIKLLRYAALSTSPEFASAAGVSRQLLTLWENGRVRPDQGSLEKVIQASVLQGLGIDTKAIQYLRLQGVEENGEREGDDEPMALNKLQGCDFGELMRYLRRLRGVTQKVLGSRLGYSKSQIEGFEHGTESINEAFVKRLIIWLGLDKSDSALADILRHKAQKVNELILEETLQRVLTEQYLFNEHLEQLSPYRLSDKDKDVQPWLNSMSVAKRVSFLRERAKLTKTQLAQKAKVSRPTIILAESEHSTPKDISLLQIAGALGYDDIHNPILLSLMNKVEEERVAEEKSA